MKKSRFTEEQIAYALKQAELGTPVAEVCRKMGISDATFYNWRTKSKQTDDAVVVEEIRRVIADLPSYGYRRVWGTLRNERVAAGQVPFNAKRIYRVMRTHSLLMQRRPTPARQQRRHDGKVAVARSNQRWCSDGFEFRCDNGEPLRVTFALDCCDREAMSWAATTAGHSGDIVRDVMLAAVENRFGNELHTPSEIEWLSDNGSGYTADDTRRFAAAIGLKPLTTPVCSPQSNGAIRQLRRMRCSMRRHEHRTVERLGQREARAHALRFLRGRQSEQPFELAAELRRARITDRIGRRFRRQILTHHQQTRLMQPRRFQVLHRRRMRDRLEVAVKARHAHAGLGRKPPHVERARIVGVNYTQRSADPAELSAHRQRASQRAALRTGQHAEIQLAQ
ncbi:TPA: DDE-type integrase/transposase/recombinase [Burkholderia vietnamiensis]|nr:DDE-type integrase/transposase/recombinase [Burkholderia vietnamiensis]HDR9044058.1 DDE-type integrase/transposase/recombinase [Burkholderia vietnamiensis]HDR9069428.1 DDE-type integrase/transposase/recombinase [Burkholderia vietnamiensis]